MAKSGKTDIQVTQHNILRFSWETISTSQEGNYSEISWGLYLINDGFGAISSNAEKDWSVTISYKTYSGTVIIGSGSNRTVTLASGTQSIYHDTYGHASFSYSFSQFFGITFSGEYIGTVSGSGRAFLDSIPRNAYIQSAPNFTDEDISLTIGYYNPLGSNATALQACIANNGGTETFADYRDIDKNGTSYTFNLTEEERTKLLKASANSNTITVKFYVTTFIGNIPYYSTLNKTFTVVNGAPILEPVVRDTNDTTIALTGNGSILVKHHSNVSVAFGAAAKKEATITAKSVVCGNKSLTNDGTIEKVESGTFNFSVTDSRNNTVTKTLNHTLIEYIKLTCDIKVEAPSAEGVLNFSISGNYYNGSFGTNSNTLIVEYRYRENDGEYGGWNTLEPALNGNSYSAEKTIENLNYQSIYTFQARARDALDIVYSGEYKVKTIPLFDWGENDFNFNVPVSIQGNAISDFIIEQGEESGWFYRKWASGIAECWCIYYETGVNAAATNYGGFYYSPTIAVSFPFTFANLPTVIVDGGSTSHMNFVRSFGRYSDKATFTVVGLSNVTSTDISVDIKAIGRWK